jgi:hypothetical protein
MADKVKKNCMDIYGKLEKSRVLNIIERLQIPNILEICYLCNLQWKYVKKYISIQASIFLFVSSVIPVKLRGCSMAISILQSQNFRFQIYHLPCRKLGFYSINTFMFVLNQGAHTSFKKNILKQIRMSLVLEYNWHKTAVFTKHKHIILTWENSLKCCAWQLSFALSYKWCYIEKILKTWQYPTMDDSARDFFRQT